MTSHAEREARPRGSRVARIISTIGLALAVVLALTALFGSRSDHRYTLLFETGGQLVSGNEVLVGGRPIGTVDGLDLTDEGQAAIEVTLDRPLPQGTTAQIRSTSLSGIANRYIALQLGPDPDETIPEGSTLSVDRTSAPVDLDQLFNVFDGRTRRALQDVIAGQATLYAGREREANRTYRYLAPGLDASRRLLAELGRDQRAFEEFLVSGSSVLGAVAERRGELSELTGNAHEALGAIAAENDALDRTLAELPPAMRQANTTFVNLRAALDDLDPLVETTRRTTEDLAPFLREVRPVAQRAVPVFRDLRAVVARPGRDNDLADALVDLPRAARAARRAVPDARVALAANDDGGTRDEVAVLRPYSPDLLAWIANLGQVTAPYDANGHYARVQPAGANLFAWDEPFDGDDDDGGLGPVRDLYPIPPSDQFDAYAALGTGPFERCPGAATQPIAGSNPFLDDGALAGVCDPSDVPPGP